MSEALVIGSVALDSVDTPYGSVDRALGGSASYGSVAASYFAQTSLVGVVGKDFPEEHVAQFNKRGINTDSLKVEEGETFYWSGYYEKTMAQAHTNTTMLNVFETFRPELTEAQKSIPYVFLANIDPKLQLHVLDQLQSPKMVALDTMNLWIEIAKQDLAKVIERVSLLLVNDEEARMFCETSNLIEAGHMLRKMGPETVVIKKGENGALVFRPEGLFSIPAYPLQSLKDPTGAGDTFAGSLLGYLARMDTLDDTTVRRALTLGTVMASFVVEDFSLRRTLSIEPGEIQERVEHLMKMTALPEIDPDSLIQRAV